MTRKNIQKRSPTVKPGTPERDALLIANGYEIFPAGDKNEVPLNWNANRGPLAPIAEWRKECPDYHGTGMRCAGLVIVDLDFVDPGIGLALRALAREKLGPAPCRIKSKPGGQLFYRAATPWRGNGYNLKATAEMGVPLDRPEQVEFKVDGHQVYIEGPDIHWEGGDLASISRAELTEVTLAQILDYREAAAALLAGQGYELASRAPRDSVQGQRKALDRPFGQCLAEATAYLESLPAASRTGDNNEWFKVAAKVRDSGVDQDTAFMLMVDKLGVDDGHYDDLAKIVANTWRYGQNEPGAGIAGQPYQEPEDPRITFKHFEGFIPPRHEPEVEVAAARKRWQGRTDEESADLPDLEFWDDEKTYVKGPNVVVAYGASGAHKTGVVLADLIELCIRGARVMYCAGEGSHGFEKLRLQAAKAARGVKSLGGRWLTIDAVPIASDVEAFEDRVQEFKPDFIVIDTLAAATPGMNENEAQFGALLTSTGRFGRLARITGGPVILIHHSGKDEERGARGSSSITANADTVFEIKADHAARTISKYVEKLRDGEAQFTVNYAVTPKGQVPVVIAADKADGKPKRKPEADPLREAVAAALDREGIIGRDKAVAPQELAELMQGPRPREDDPALAQWIEHVGKRRKAIDNGMRGDNGHGRAMTPRLAGYFEPVLNPDAKTTTRKFSLPLNLT